MKSLPVKRLSLPARLSLAVMAVLIPVTVIADALAMREIRLHMAVSVADTLAWTTGRMARQLDRDIAYLKDLLREQAEAVRNLSPDDAAAVLQHSDPALRFAFDYGVILVAPSGLVTADSRDRDIWKDANVAERRYFQATFATRTAMVSEPFAAEHGEGPAIVVVTAPLADASGRLRGLLAGGIDPANNRILDQATGAGTGRHGQIGIFTLDGRVVTHSEKSLILDVFENPLPFLPEPGGPGITMDIVTADGSRAFLAVSRPAGVDWLIAGVFPVDELYHPIDKGFTAAHWWFAAGLAICCGLVLLLSHRAIRDLDLLAKEVESIGLLGKTEDPSKLSTDYRGEAGMVAGAINSMLDSLAAARCEILDLSTRLAETEERQRRAIAQDLHDSVCQTLALAKMRLGGLAKKAGDPSRKGEVEEIKGLLDESVGELKTLIFDLSPGILYELGLPSALDWYAGEYTKKYRIQATVRVRGHFKNLDQERAVFLYRAAGELLVNAAKHAYASIVTVELFRENGTTVLEVRDNGKGMREASGAGFGLRNLRARARSYGGGVTFREPPEGGTVARVWTSGN